MNSQSFPSLALIIALKQQAERIEKHLEELKKVADLSASGEKGTK